MGSIQKHMLSKLCLPAELLQVLTIFHTSIVIAILLWFKASIFISGAVVSFLAMNLSLMFNIKNQQINKTFDDYAVLLMLPFLTLVYLSHLPSLNHHFVNNREYLQKTEIIVPSKPTCTKNNRFNSCSFKANDMYFNCNYDIRARQDDDCESLYRYGGQKANVFYQPIDKVNLIYELDLESQKPYEFTQQYITFQSQQNIAKRTIFWLLLSFVIPSLFLYFQYFVWGNKLLINNKQTA